jgi:hypothetical protein
MQLQLIKVPRGVTAVPSDGAPLGVPDEPVFVDVLLITINIDIALFSYCFHRCWHYALRRL